MVDKKSSRINRHDTSPLINCESMTALQRLSHVYFVQFSITKQQRGFRTNRKITFFMHTIPAQFFMTSSSNIVDYFAENKVFCHFYTGNSNHCSMYSLISCYCMNDGEFN